MPEKRMHVDEIEIDQALVANLISTQFPRWAHLPITPVASSGTQNAIYRLGDDLAVRLPRIRSAAQQIERDRRWLPHLAPQLPLAIPVPLAQGRPAFGYPCAWSVHPWLPGEPATTQNISDLRQAAVDVAQFLNALHQIDSGDGPLAEEHNLRGMPLRMRDKETRQAIAALAGKIDTAAVTKVWEAALQAPDWNRKPVWFHGDMLPGNLLVDRGRISAIIDFGGQAVGDPACDLMIAWGLFSGESRKVFRAALRVGDATWDRGRGHALAQALIFIPYYLHTNPTGVAVARRTIAEILVDTTTNERV